MSSMADSGLTAVECPLTGRSTFVAVGPVAERWQPPTHVRLVKRRKHHYLVCACGKERRVVLYQTSREDDAARWPDIEAMHWCDFKHKGCGEPAAESTGRPGL